MYWRSKPSAPAINVASLQLFPSSLERVIQSPAPSLAP
jgi:hypothetical protein